MNMRTKKIAGYGMLIALAMVLSYLESLIPAFFAVPGVKLGLTNIVVLWALYLEGWKGALLINAVRVVLVGLLFGNGMSILYSLAGALLSGAVMILLKQSGKFGVITVSICGGIAHNVGQILVAMLVTRTASLAWYLLILWFSGLLTGAGIGVLGGELIRRLPSSLWRSE